jgi:hypothetical protein
VRGTEPEREPIADYGRCGLLHGSHERPCFRTYGRIVVLNERVLLFASPEDAAEHIGFDLQPVE